MAGKNYKIKKLSNFKYILYFFIYEKQTTSEYSSFEIIHLSEIFFFCYDFNQNNENNN